LTALPAESGDMIDRATNVRMWHKAGVLTGALQFARSLCDRKVRFANLTRDIE